MKSEAIRKLLGQLQSDPDAAQAWESLVETVTGKDRDIEAQELETLLVSGLPQHQERGEWTAVARLLEIAISITEDEAKRVEYFEELARVCDLWLFSSSTAEQTWQLLRQRVPNHAAATAALVEQSERRSKWQQLERNYAQEAQAATDDVYRSSMLMRAAEMELRYAPEPNEEHIIEHLEQAVRLDATNTQAGRMLERLYRRGERWEDVARVLDRMAVRGTEATERRAAAVRLARLYRYRLEDSERAATAYERLLRETRSYPEAIEYLANLYSAEKRWEELVALYEHDLSGRDANSPDALGNILQIAMLHYRVRESKADAEPWFEKVRKIDPSHEGMLEFFRDYCRELGDESRWIDVLQGAQRAMPDGKVKAKAAVELAELAEKQTNAQRAIEQYRAVLRQDPDNEPARDALKRLLKATQGFTTLVELLRQQLEHTPAEEYEKRLSILREVAAVYRQYLRNDTALVTVLHQIVMLDEKLDEHDVEELRELVSLYDKLGRHRELLTYQLKLAEVSPDIEEKTKLYRAAARRWLEQFSNFQNATEAYEALLKVAPRDPESMERLNELYRKRRAWSQLFDLLSLQVDDLTGPQRVSVLWELAQLAADRLHRPEDATKLYRQLLDLDETRVDAIDALEKHAERNKDWETLAFVLERRTELVTDSTQQSAILQKLGAVYLEHLQDVAATVRTWRRVLALQPGHPRALRVLRDTYLQNNDFDGLTELYGSQNDWDGLVEVLGNTADRTTDNALRVDLSYRAAAIFERQLEQPQRAFRSYERALATDPTDVRAARALIPLYESDEKWSRLPALYELLLARAEGEEEQLELLGKLVDVTGRRLLDRKAAFAHARRAYEQFPQNENVCQMFEQAARQAQMWDGFLDALEQRAAQLIQLGRTVTTVESTSTPEVDDNRGGKKRGKRKGKRNEPEATATRDSDKEAELGTEHRTIVLIQARILSEELARIGEAVDKYKEALQRNPGDELVDSSLMKLLTSNDRREDLRWLYEHRVANAGSDAEKIAILLTWAELERTSFGDKAQSAELYRRILSINEANDVALAALADLLLAADKIEDAASIIERRRKNTEGAERVELEVRLAELYSGRLARPEDALVAAVSALERAPEDSRALNVVEQLLDVDGVRRDAAMVLANRFASGGEARREAQALSVLLESADAKEQKLALVRRLTAVYDQKLASTGTALTVVLKALSEYPDELELWDTAEELAVRSGRPTDLVETLRTVLNSELPKSLELSLCERAARVNEERLGDPIGATPYLERILKLDAENDRAFSRLKDILTAAERWGELEDMYDRAISLTSNQHRRIDMLIEVALISEEILEDGSKSIEHYEKILEIDPNHLASLESLDRLYSRHDRFEQLAKLLARRLELATPEESAPIKRRLAQLLLDRLHRPDEAIGLVQNLLIENYNDRDARTLAERLLEIGSLRADAAKSLEHVYEARDEIRDLVRVLSIQLECLGSVSDATLDQRKDVLRRIAHLRDTRLHDDQGAFEAFASLVPLEPSDADVRQRLLDIGRRLNNLSTAAEAMSEAARNADSLSVRAEILMQVASVQENGLNNVAAAEACYREIVALDPEDAATALPAAQQLERIYVGGSQPSQLAEVLRIQEKLEDSGERRRRLRLRLGELCRDVLGDIPGSIKSYQACVAEKADDDVALEALDGLYERIEAWSDLAHVLEQRQALATDEATRRTLGVRRAQLVSDRLNDLDMAVNVWRRLMEELGPDRQGLSALESLHERQKAWPELADTLESHLEIVGSGPEQLELLAKLGDVRRVHMSNSTAALDAYRRALAIDSKHPPTRAALEAMLDHADMPARKDAADVLHPIFEAEHDSARLARVLDILIETTDDPVDRLAWLEKASKVAELELKDAGRAFGYVVRGTREAVGHSDLAQWLQHLRGLATAAGQESAQVKLLREIVGDIFDGETQLAVTLEIASMAQSALNDRDLAREYYEKALEQHPDNRTALIALQSIHEQSNDIRSLLDITARRVESALDGEERKQLLFRQAKLLSENLGEKAQAIEVYERIVESDADPVAVQELELLYRNTQRWDALVALLQKRAELPGADLAAIHVATAVVWADNVGDMARALDELELALRGKRPDDAAVAALEKILTGAKDIESRARAATLLEPVYLMQSDFRRVIGTLKARLDATSDPIERKELLARLAKIYEEQTEEYVEALETTALLFQEDPADEVTQGELERLAKVSAAQARLAEIYAGVLDRITIDDVVSAKLAQRAADIYLSEDAPAQALKYYSRALAFDPENSSLFMEVDALLQRLSKHPERVALYRKSLEYQYDAGARVEALHVIADLQKGPLSDIAAAIETLREALEIDDSHPQTLDSLATLYRQQGRFTDLAQLLLRRAEGAVYPSESAGHRLTLARLYTTELNEPERALEQLEEIVRYEPRQPNAIEMLEVLRLNPQLRGRVVDVLRPLYESADEWQKLIRLNEDRFDLADNIADKVSVLRETATLYEVRGHDPERARQAYAFALEADPDDSSVRAEFERLTLATNQWEELRNTYEKLLLRPELLGKRDVIALLAQTCDQRLDDPRRALALYWMLYELEPGDRQTIEQIERLATLLSDWGTLVKALIEKTDLLTSDEERASCWRQIGEARRDMLEDRQGAIIAYERALELDPNSAFTVDSLIDLLDSTGSYERMVELLVRRMELCEDDAVDEKFEHLVRAGDVTTQSIKDPVKAIDLFVRALTLRPTDLPLLVRLEGLYSQQGQWTELLENLRAQCELCTDAAARGRLRNRMGTLLANDIGSYEEALDTYRQVFEDIRNDESTIQSLLMIASGHEELRSAVAGILLPVLESASGFDRVVEVLELRLTSEHDSIQRCQTLRTIADVQETKLANPRGALDSLLRAVTERPDEPTVHADVERLAEEVHDWRKVRDVLGERAQATFDPDLACELYSRLGRIAEAKLDDPLLAEQSFSAAVAQAGDRPELLEALDRLYARLGNWRSLADILERRAAAVSGSAEQAEFYNRLARIQLEQFNEPVRALGSIRQVLERAPEDAAAIALLESLTEQRDLFEETAEILESVYRTSRQPERLVALLAKRVASATDTVSRLEYRRTLAQILEDECNDPARALDVLVDAMTETTGDVRLLDGVERLADITKNYARPAAALEEALQVRPPASTEMARDVWIRLASWQRDRLLDSAAAERSLLHALEWDSNNDDILVQLESLRRVPGRERDLVDTLRQRARMTLSDEIRADLFQQARQVAASINDTAMAEAIVRELLGFDDANLWAITELTALRRGAEDWAETLKLLLRRAELEADSRILHDIRHEAATVARERLSNTATAIKLYSQLFDDDPMDELAGNSLKGLLLEAKDFESLIQILSRLVDVAKGPSERAELRLQLSRVYDEDLDKPQAAISELNAILDEVPNHAPAVVALSKIYEKLGANEDMAELLERQIRQAEAASDQDAKVELQMRLGEVCETRLGDVDRALATFRLVLDSLPNHRGALEALIRLREGQGDLAQAATLLESLVAIVPEAERTSVGVRLADTRERLGDERGALMALQRALVSDPRNKEIRMRARSLSEKMGDWDGVAKLLSDEAELVEVAADKVGLLREAAKIRSDKAQDWSKAAALLEQASGFAPNDRELLLSLCDAYTSSGRAREAAMALERIVESYGGRRTKELGEIHRRLAQAYLSQGEPDRAKDELEKAFRIEPGNVRVIALLADVCLQINDAKRAQQLYSSLIIQIPKLGPDSPISKAEIYAHRGEASRILGEKQKAISDFERALQADPTMESVKAKLAELKA